MRTTTSCTLSLALLGTLALAGPGRAETRSPTEVVREFYDAFCADDKAEMESLYAPDVKWKDTIFAFGDREGTMAMWRTLGQGTSNRHISYQILRADGDTVVVNWLADYTVNATKNRVHNDVTATLVVKDGKIVKHDDVYSWDRWAAQALPGGDLGIYSIGFMKDATIGLMNLFLKAQIAAAKHEASLPSPPPSQTHGLNGALGGLGR